MGRHSTYWSCTPFADWLRGTAKPGAASARGWREWKKKAKAAHPFRFWLAEEFIGDVQDLITWPKRKLQDIDYYIQNRFITKSHALTAHPEYIKPGRWMDLSNRFLPCMFSELVNFVEIETAWHHIAWNDDARKKFNAPGRFRRRNWRCPEAGLAHISWAMTLVYNENMGINKGHALYGKPTPQAEDAKEVYELYKWWTTVRPNRVDPSDASGWSAHCNKRRSKDPDDDMAMLDSSDETPQERQDVSKILDNMHAMEAQYEKEDEDMMIRLIKVRRGLWT